MTHEAKHRVLEAFALVAKALGSGHRLELLELLAQGERTVEDLSRISGLHFANCSQHLQQLKRVGLVDARRDGRRVYYRLSDHEVVALVAGLRRIAERSVAEVERVVSGYFRELDSLEPVSRKELVNRMRRGEVTILDVRPAEEFEVGHLPGALNVSVEDLERRLADFPPNQEIVAYCRGPYCVLSFEAVDFLRRHGFDARRLEDGFPEWRLAGLEVEGAGAVTL